MLGGGVARLEGCSVQSDAGTGLLVHGRSKIILYYIILYVYNIILHCVILYFVVLVST